MTFGTGVIKAVLEGRGGKKMLREVDKAFSFKKRLRAGQACAGVQIALTDPTIAELFGRAGFHWLVVDMEHGANDAFTLRGMLQAATHTDAVVLARPRRLDVDAIRQYLDLGAQGIFCPFIETGEQAQQLVSACRYPPAGIRGFGPRRAGGYGFDAEAYFQQANNALLCIAIIESQKAVDSIEAIISVDGLDGIYIGPYDLSISLGLYKQFEHPRYIEAVEHCRQAARKHNKAMGAGGGLDESKKQMARGDLLFLVGGDDVYLASESKRCLQALFPPAAVEKASG